MAHEKHDRRFSPRSMKKLDALERFEFQHPDVLLDALAIEPDTVLVDLGVGTGFIALRACARLVEMKGAGRVVGLDVEPLMLDEVTYRATTAQLEDRFEAIPVTGKGKLPLVDALADRVVVLNTAHELDNRPTVCRELFRILRPGGFAVIVDWSPEGPFDKGPPAEHRLNPAKLERELKAAGFTVERLPLYERFFSIRAAHP